VSRENEVISDRKQAFRLVKMLMNLKMRRHAVGLKVPEGLKKGKPYPIPACKGMCKPLSQERGACRGVEKGVFLVFAFLEVYQQANTRHCKYYGDDCNDQQRWERAFEYFSF
jgi:hypothetical protein